MIPDLELRLSETVALERWHPALLLFEYGRGFAAAGDVWGVVSECEVELEMWCGRNGLMYGGLRSVVAAVPSLSCGRGYVRVVACVFGRN